MASSKSKTSPATFHREARRTRRHFRHPARGEPSATLRPDRVRRGPKQTRTTDRPRHQVARQAAALAVLEHCDPSVSGAASHTGRRCGQTSRHEASVVEEMRSANTRRRQRACTFTDRAPVSPPIQASQTVGLGTARGQARIHLREARRKKRKRTSGVRSR